MSTSSNLSQNCISGTPTPPPTTPAWCAIPIGTNRNESFASYCQGAPIAAYNDFRAGGSSPCYLYCNISNTAFSNSAVINCLYDAFQGHVEAVSEAHNVSVAGSSATERRASSRLAWAVLSLVSGVAVLEMSGLKSGIVSNGNGTVFMGLRSGTQSGLEVY
jgi:hypothetical protein